MVDRKKGKDEAIEGSFETDVSASKDAGELTEEQKRISTIFELTDISELSEDDASIDLLKASITDLIKEVQEQVEMVLSGKVK
jgi:phage host-nuclease inhibitor protein Gam